MKIGDTVRVTKIPEDLPPGDKALNTLFRGCLNKTFTVVAFDGKLAELHVGEAFGEAPAKHQIWLDAEHVKVIEA